MSMMSTLRQQIAQMISGGKDARVMQLAQGYDNPYRAGMAPEVMDFYNQDALQEHMKIEYGLMERMMDYEAMEDFPEVSAAIRVMASDATQPDTPTSRRIWIESGDKDIKVLLNDFLHRTLGIDNKLYKIAKIVSTYGNCYGEVVAASDGVLDLRILPATTMRRIEGTKGETYGFVQDFKRRIGYTPTDFARLRQAWDAQAAGGKNPMTMVGAEDAIPFDPWQVVHFRYDDRAQVGVYGCPPIDAARWAWKRLVLMEDSALIFRLQRAPERLVYYVNVGNKSPTEAARIVNMVRQQFKKQKFINRETNQVDMRFDVLTPTEDIFVPSFNGQDSTRIEVLTGPAWQAIEDINYFRQKMKTALLVPGAYLGMEEGSTKAVLSSEDVRFARTILSIQQVIKQGVARLCEVHLAVLGIPAERVAFDVHMPVPSSIFELAQMEVKNARADLALREREIHSLPWIYRTVYGMNEAEIKQAIQERSEDLKRDAVVAAQAQSAAAEFAPQEEEGGASFESRAEAKKARRLQEEALDAKKTSGEVARLLRSVDKLAGGVQQTLHALDRHARHIDSVHNLLRSVAGRTAATPQKRAGR